MKPQEKEDILYVQDKRFSHLFSALPEHRRTYAVSFEAVRAIPNNLAFVPLKHLTEAIIKQAVEKDGFAIEHVPPYKLNEEICNIAVKQNGGALEFVPEKLQTPELYMSAVQNNGLALGLVPEKAKTKELCGIAVKNSAEALEYVPKEFITPGMCMNAVKDSGWALEFVPEEMKTKEMCRIALESSPDLGGGDCEILAFVPFSDVALEGLKKFEHSLADPHDVFGSINPEIMTPEIAMYGVKMEATCLNMVPERLKTPELYMEAVKGDGFLLGNVPEEQRTKKLCEAAIQSNYHSLKFVPEQIPKKGIYRKAIEVNSFAIQYIPVEMRTHELCEKALKNATDPNITSFFPHPDYLLDILNKYCKDGTGFNTFMKCLNYEYMDQALADAIIKREPNYFYKIPEQFKTKELCDIAIKQTGSNFSFVPESLKTKEYCMDAINQSYYAIPGLPEELKTRKFYMELVALNPQNLNGIPDQDKTYEMCKMAYDNTFGKDKTDFSVISAITSPSILLDAFQKTDDPKHIDLMMNVINGDLKKGDILKEAMSKNGDCIHLINSENITTEIAEIAVKNHPGALRWVPKKVQTPDMCLYAVTSNADPSIKNAVSYDIQKGDNIYSFHLRIESAINRSLTYQQHKDLYAGKALPIYGEIRTTTGNFKDRVLRFDTETGKLSHTPIQAKEQKSEHKPGIKQPNRSKKQKL